ncbi:MAG: hypothetical protein WDW36_007155 [Sanguina aurantia]
MATAAASVQAPAQFKAPPAGDPSTLSNPSVIRVTHSDFEFDVSFENKVIEGYVALTAVAQVDSPGELVLDTHGLQVAYAEQVLPGAVTLLGHRLGEHPVLGSALTIALPEGMEAGDEITVGVRFTTSPSATALQFLEPSQTAGKVHPYLFTQCQAIHARSMVPCQDSPGAKMSYTAAVRVPAELTALMSAVPCETSQVKALPMCRPSNMRGVPVQLPLSLPQASPTSPAPPPSYPTALFSFTQAVPIPPYLLALAVGQLEARELSPRSRVWSEPCMVEAGAFEFAETAKYLDAGEAIAGPYVWGRYDLLLLPPSFPYGGMENPCLTFVTPTLLAGDRSLTNVVAHEIAHSWAGNLVTNSSWQDFFLNEGMTVFLERKILERLAGGGEAGRKVFHLRAAQGVTAMEEEVRRLGPTHKYTALVPDLSDGGDPDDAFSRIPYEKGFYLLYFLQELLGGATVFEPFVRSYFEHFKFSTVSHAQFKDYLTFYFIGSAALKTVDWDAWFYSPGMPPVLIEFDTSLADDAYKLALDWHTCDVMGIGGKAPAGCSPADIQGWSSEQLLTFLDKLASLRCMTPLSPRVARQLEEVYSLGDRRNAEIRLSWYLLAIKSECEEVLPQVVEFLTSQGRMKYLRPLYRALKRSKMGSQLAQDTFRELRGTYHPIAQKMVAADLGL